MNKSRAIFLVAAFSLLGATTSVLYNSVDSRPFRKMASFILFTEWIEPVFDHVQRVKGEFLKADPLLNAVVYALAAIILIVAIRLFRKSTR
jgi:hypothetical protein